MQKLKKAKPRSGVLSLTQGECSTKYADSREFFFHFEQFTKLKPWALCQTLIESRLPKQMQTFGGAPFV